MRSEFKRCRISILAAAVTTAAATLSGGAARATQYQWTGNGGTGSPGLSVASNWTNSTPPSVAGGADLLFTSPATTTTPTDDSGYYVDSITFNPASPAFTFKASPTTNVLVINNTSGSGLTGIIDNATTVQTFNDPISLGISQTWSVVAGGTLNCTNNINTGTATLTVAPVGTAVLANVNGNGGLTFNGSGTLTLAGNNTYLGATNVYGGGTFVVPAGVTDGTSGASFVVSGINTTAMTLAGTVNAANQYVGVNSNGFLTQTGGTDTVASTLYIAQNSTSNSSYTLNNGSVSAPTILVGSYGNGTFNQTGGTVNASTFLYLARFGGTGNYNLSGAVASSIIITQELNIGVTGTGTFTQSGGDR